MTLALSAASLVVIWLVPSAGGGFAGLLTFIMLAAFLQCTLKGLQRSPRIIPQPQLGQSGLIDATNVSCLVIPDGCIGIPTLAALAQGIPVIAVRENKNLMRNDLTLLPWKPGQLIVVENYWEAAGVIVAMRAGIAPKSVRRPFHNARNTILKTDIALDLARRAESVNLS